jgi:hypothetical protein
MQMLLQEAGLKHQHNKTRMRHHLLKEPEKENKKL